VLSGFLITRILLNKAEHRDYFRNFYFRRTLRIFPLYYFALVLVFFVSPLLPVISDIDYLIDRQTWFWLYLENWLFAFEGWPDGQNFIVSHFWSLAIEEQYYLIWPLVVFSLRGRQRVLSYTIVFLICVALGLRLSGKLGDPAFYTVTFARMDSLLIGSLVAVTATNAFESLKKWAPRILLISGLILGVVILFSKDLGYTNRFFSTVGYSVLACFFAALVVLSFRTGTLLRWTLDSMFLKTLGRYSYGLYVFHFIVYWMFRPAVLESLHFIQTPFIAKSVAALILLIFTFSLTLLSYHLLELPFLRLKRFFV
jgi:peptidoglycan/LPS O-acetylase OafA/YrhL